MTDTQHDEQPQATFNPRKMNLALMALMDELADDVNAMYPWNKPDSAEHVANYTALMQAFGCIEKLLIAAPPDRPFREMVYAYVGRAWDLTHGDPDHDEAVKRAAHRASQDYQSTTPEQLRRTVEPKAKATKGGAKPS